MLFSSAQSHVVCSFITRFPTPFDYPVDVFKCPQIAKLTCCYEPCSTEIQAHGVFTFSAIFATRSL